MTTFHQFTKGHRVFRQKNEPQIACDIEGRKAHGWEYELVYADGEPVHPAVPEKPVEQLSRQPPSSPLVSIVMPACDTALPYVRRAIRSCRDQTYTNWDLCIALDGPDEELLGIVEAEAERDARVRFAVGPKAGYAVAMNWAFALCRGSVIARLDADDSQHPERLERQVAMLSKSEIGIVSCGMTWIGTDDEVLKVFPPIPMRPEAYLSTGCSLCGASAIARREVYDQNGCYDASPEIASSPDSDWNMRTLIAGVRWAYLDEPWYYQRRHAGQLSVDWAGQQATAANLRQKYAGAVCT